MIAPRSHSDVPDNDVPAPAEDNGLLPVNRLLFRSAINESVLSWGPPERSENREPYLARGMWDDHMPVDGRSARCPQCLRAVPNVTACINVGV